jgi:hypothetical protein
MTPYLRVARNQKIRGRRSRAYRLARILGRYSNQSSKRLAPPS